MRVWYTNEELSDVLERVADLVQAQHPKRGSREAYRAAAFRKAAASVRGLDRPVISVLDAEGLSGLERIVGVGKSIAASLRELVETGRLRYLERLEGAVSPEDLFTTIPGIGEALATRIHEQLHAETLEDLEVAAHDGRLEQLPGVGQRRAHAIRDLVGHMLGQSTRRRARRIRSELEEHHDVDFERPTVATILGVDAEYLIDVEADVLMKIAPKRFNPDGRAWLPVMHVDRDGFHFTALFSNTARAHELHTTHDWVVLFYEQDGHEDQCTVVTETHGHLKGHRVVRGRETECRAHYAHLPEEPPEPRPSERGFGPDQGRRRTSGAGGAPGDSADGPWLPGLEPDEAPQSPEEH